MMEKILGTCHDYMTSSSGYKLVLSNLIDTGSIELDSLEDYTGVFTKK